LCIENLDYPQTDDEINRTSLLLITRFASATSLEY
jgi:hypothetical protein